MADLRTEHVVSCTEAVFWDQVYFNLEYNTRLFTNELGFPTWNQLELSDSGSEVTRLVEATPSVGELPGVLKAIAKEGVGYREKSVFNKQGRRCKVDVTPYAFSDKISVKVEVWTEPEGSGKCKRLVTAKVVAKIFGVGGILERKMIADLERAYDKSARFTDAFVAEKHLL